MKVLCPRPVWNVSISPQRGLPLVQLSMLSEGLLDDVSDAKAAEWTSGLAIWASVYSCVHEEQKGEWSKSLTTVWFKRQQKPSV